MFGNKCEFFCSCRYIIICIVVPRLDCKMFFCFLTFIAEFFEPPSNTMAILGQDEDVVFNCFIQGTGVSWQIDGIVYNITGADSLESRGITIQMNINVDDVIGTVTVRVSPENNATEIVCIAEEVGRTPRRSSPVYLIIKCMYSLTKIQAIQYQSLRTTCDKSAWL